MRERVTYILTEPGAGDFDPSSLEITPSTLAVPGLAAVKEHRLALSPAEVPAPLSRVLRNAQSLHLRWSSPVSRAAERPPLAPFVSRTAPGLHVFLTPLPGRSAKRLCALLRDVFGARVKCGSVDAAFTNSTRGGGDGARQFFYYVPDLAALSLWVQREVCGAEAYACRLRATDLEGADAFDVEYDASGDLVLRAVWTKANGDDGKWYETHMRGGGAADSLEVGVLVNEIPESEEDLRYSGFLTQIGKDAEPLPTLFSFPSRHHSLPASSQLTYRASFAQPTGLHPILTLSFSTTPKAPFPDCALHTYLTLPSPVFLDRYAFADAVFLRAHNLRALRSFTGEGDLEAPEWTTDAWGSAALLELAIPENSPSEEKGARGFQATIPLHARYLPPQRDASRAALPLPVPPVFWSCASRASDARLRAAPFDRRVLGYDLAAAAAAGGGAGGAAPGDGALRFYHVPHAPSAPAGLDVIMLPVPVLDASWAGPVGWGTVLAVVAGAAWVLGVAARAVWRDGVGGRASRKKGSKAE